LVRARGSQNFHSGAMVCKLMYGNPFKAELCAALLHDGLQVHEIYEIMHNHWEMDRQRLGVGALDPDPWLDPIKVLYNKEGGKAGNNLSMRAWIKVALGLIHTKHNVAFNTLFFLVFMPSGLDHTDFVQCHQGADFHSVLLVIFEQYKLVELVDVWGIPNVEITTAKLFLKEGRGKGKLRLRPSVRQVMLDPEFQEQYPDQAKGMMRFMLLSLRRQAEVINQNLTRFQTTTAMRQLVLIEENLWTAIDYSLLMRPVPDVLGKQMELVDECGKIALFMSLIMMSLGRLSEALEATIFASRFFGYIIRHELSGPQIRLRQRSDGLRLKTPGQLAQAFRVAGEVKLTLGAHVSAAEDLQRALVLSQPIKFAAIGYTSPGSRVGQADVLWSMSECELQKGNHSQAARLIRDCIRMYEEDKSLLGVAMAKHLSGQIRTMTGNLTQAFKDLNDCVHVYREWNALGRLAEALVHRAEVCVATSNLSRAKHDLFEARNLHAHRHDVAGEAMTYKMEAEILVATGELVPATEAATYAKELASQINQTYIVAEALRIQGEIASVRVVLGEKHPRHKVAVSFLKRALTEYESIGYYLGMANCRRALATIFRKTRHWHHHETQLRHALHSYQQINHRLGIALIKTDLARLAGLRNHTHEASELLQDALPALEEVQARYRIAEQTGMMVTEGNGFQSDKHGADVMVEWDPFWQSRLSDINFEATGESSAGDLVRSVLNNHALSVDNAGMQMRTLRVGETGDELLDLPQTWVDGHGWFFSDDAELRAFDEIHWLNMDQKGQKEALAKAKRGQQYMERLMTRMGINADASDEEIKEKAARTFNFFDDDASGKLSYGELENAFSSLGINMDKHELEDMVAQMDTDGDGTIDLDEFQTMLLKTLRNATSTTGMAPQNQQEYEDHYRAALAEQKEKVYICVYLCMLYICVCIILCVCVCVCVCARARACVCVCMYVCMCTHTHTHTHTHRYWHAWTNRATDFQCKKCPQYSNWQSAATSRPFRTRRPALWTRSSSLKGLFVRERSLSREAFLLKGLFVPLIGFVFLYIRSLLPLE